MVWFWFEAIWKREKIDMEVLGLSLFPFQKIGRYVTPASRSHISHECSPLRWAISCKHEIAPLLDIGCLNGNGEEV